MRDLPAAIGGHSNSISDLRPIAGLPLTFLGIVNNQITDISVLSSLDRLRRLYMGADRIEFFQSTCPGF